MQKRKINNSWMFWKDGHEEQKTEVTLPHDAMILEQRQPELEKGNATGFYPGGKYFYEKTIFAGEELAGKSVILEFEGVYMKSRVWLNGEEVGSWVYGYTNFYIDLTGKLNIGQDNALLVEVDNSLTPNSRWYSGSGIYRDVNLYIGAGKHIAPDGIQVKTLSYSPAVVEIRVEATEGANVVCTVLDGETVITSGRGTVIQLAIPNAKLWDDEHPNLYTVRAEIVDGGKIVDTAACRMGIRKLQWDSSMGLRVNGRTVKLRGGCVHHDHGPLGARSFEKAEYRRLSKLKEMGYNSIRYAHNPTSRVFLEICDELGLYVLDETFDQWLVPQSAYDYAIYFESEWQKDVRVLIHKDYSHPSVIMYCVGNEITDTGLPFGAGICKRINDLIKELDETRPTTIAINGMLSVLAAKAAESKTPGDSQVGSAEVNDIVTLLPEIRRSITAESLESLIGPCVQNVDIVGYNYGENLYIGLHELLPQRVILSSETFPSAIGVNWPMVANAPYVIGDFMWTCWDYLGEAGVGQVVYGTNQAPFSKGYPCQSANVGAFDLTGMPETFAYYTAIVWGKYHKPYIGVRPVNHSGEAYALGAWRMTDSRHSWSWNGCEGKTAEVEVYSPGQMVKLMLNGEEVGTERLLSWKCKFMIPYVPGVLKAVAFDADGSQIGEDVLVSAGEETMLQILPEEPTIKANGEDLAYVAVCITDASGICKMLRDRRVTISVTGAGILEAVGSAEPETTERFDSGSYTTYYGRMIAIIRSNGQVGDIQVTASAEGMGTVSTIMKAIG